MTSTDTFEVGWLPDWLTRYLSLGSANLSGRRERQSFVFNSVTVMLGIVSVCYALFYFLYDPIGLRPVYLVAFCTAFCAFAPAIAAYNRRMGLLYFASISAVCLTTLTYLLSSRSGLHLYSFILPPLALIASGMRNRWDIILALAASIAVMVISTIWFDEPQVPAGDRLLEGLLISTLVFCTCTVLGTVLLFYFRARTAEDALEAEHARSEALLYNLLPEEIAARLKVEPDRTIADKLPKVAILFADIVDFTPRAASLPAEEVVDFLNRIFSRFDELAEKHELEKIKTIGDAYMVAAGMPSPVGDPVHRIADMALDMLRVTREMSPQFPDGLEVRIGLHACTAVAGVIGNNKLFYDVWGETVNTASRMESHGEPGRIQVTGSAYEELKADYNFEERGTVDVKGIGPVETWWLTAKAISS